MFLNAHTEHPVCLDVPEGCASDQLPRENSHWWGMFNKFNVQYFFTEKKFIEIEETVLPYLGLFFSTCSTRNLSNQCHITQSEGVNLFPLDTFTLC